MELEKLINDLVEISEMYILEQIAPEVEIAFPMFRNFLTKSEEQVR